MIGVIHFAPLLLYYAFSSRAQGINKFRIVVCEVQIGDAASFFPTDLLQDLLQLLNHVKFESQAVTVLRILHEVLLVQFVSHVYDLFLAERDLQSVVTRSHCL